MYQAVASLLRFPVASVLPAAERSAIYFWFDSVHIFVSFSDTYTRADRQTSRKTHYINAFLFIFFGSFFPWLSAHRWLQHIRICRTNFIFYFTSCFLSWFLLVSVLLLWVVSSVGVFEQNARNVFKCNQNNIWRTFFSKHKIIISNLYFNQN